MIHVHIGRFGKENKRNKNKNKNEHKNTIKSKKYIDKNDCMQE